MPTTLAKDDAAVLDYQWDWSDWLGDDEAISSHTVTVPSGLTKDSDSADDTSVTVWLSGGGEAGTKHDVVCHVVTDQGREDDRTMTIVMRDR